MISVLIADDDKLKGDIVQAQCLRLLPDGEVVIERADSTTAAGVLLEQRTFDLLVLDVQMPMRDSEEPRADAGLRFLRAMYETRKMQLPKYILGLTAYEEHLTEYRREFEEHNWHVILYDESSEEWKSRLATMIFHIIDSAGDVYEGNRTDLAIITALEDVELESVLRLPGNWKVREVAGDPTIYHEGSFDREGRSLSVVAAAAIEMGMPAATAVSMKLIHEFRPRFLAMVGIAAGVKGDFGDILIADVAFDYGSGKITKGAADPQARFLPDPHPIPLDPFLKAKLSFFKTQTDVLERIRQSAVGRVLPTRLTVRMGPLASGAAVIENREVVQEVQSLWRKLVGVELETYGVFLAARLCREPRPSVMSIKAICDFADPAKVDDFQQYAAFTSAAFLYEFSLSLLARASVPMLPNRA